jgi:hypothetical protein
MGDTYGVVAIGALVGIALTICGLSIAVIFPILYPLPMSILAKRAFSRMSVKLDPGFLLVTILSSFPANLIILSSKA